MVTGYDIGTHRLNVWLLAISLHITSLGKLFTHVSVIKQYNLVLAKVQ